MFFKNNPTDRNEINNNEEREFYLGDLLSVVTGKALSKAPCATSLAAFLKFMTGESVWTFEISTISKICKPYVLAQFPQLKDVDASFVDASNYNQWMQAQVDNFGEYFKVKPIPRNEYQPHDPIEDLIKMRDGKTDEIFLMEVPPPSPKC